MKNFYISFNAEQEHTAWYKAIADVEYFLNSIGFTPIPIKSCQDNMRKCLQSYLKVQNFISEIGIILVQFPRVVVEGLNLDKFIQFIKSNYPNYKLIVLVHDLDSMRFGKYFTTNYLTEVPILNKFHYVIAVNDAMSSLLKNHGLNTNVSSLTIFDYVIPENINNKTIYNPPNISIAYAGNLKYEKSPFVYRLNKLDLDNIIINLYGPGINPNKINFSKNICYKGSFSADNLTQEIKDDFGLCWDGIYLNQCGGTIGQYLKYTNSHKTSLYLALSIPIIISKEIATAEFIKQENVGILINSLQDIPEILNNLSVSEYDKLKQNAIKLSEKLRDGYYIKNALNNIVELTGSNANFK